MAQRSGFIGVNQRVFKQGGMPDDALKHTSCRTQQHDQNELPF
ncbi:Unknown protein sequence [Pseudomonas syringae pv. maculicola]|nr:Unknown protein sequence [Pseudomonas syringae pv. maculicola]